MATIGKYLITLLIGVGLGIFLVKFHVNVPLQETKIEKVDKKVTVRETTKKNGTVIKETIIQDKVSKSSTVVPNRKKWHIDITQQLWDKDETKTLSVSRHIGMDIFVTGTANTKGDFGIGLGIEF